MVVIFWLIIYGKLKFGKQIIKKNTNNIKINNFFILYIKNILLEMFDYSKIFFLAGSSYWNSTVYELRKMANAHLILVDNLNFLD